MNLNKINCIIFEDCIKLFPDLQGLLENSEVNDKFEIVAQSIGEGNLKLVSEERVSPEKFYVRLYLEFLLNGKLSKHPDFYLYLDVFQKRAEVISFKSNLFPAIRLDSFTEINGQKYTNKVATYDITLLCSNWLKQLIDLEYKTVDIEWRNQKKHLNKIGIVC